MYTFLKAERLSNHKLVRKLLTEGQSVFVYPFKISHYLLVQADNHHPQLLILVSKRRFKLAVDRNQIKRRIRELYRLNKKQYLPQHYPCLLGINYVGKTILDYSRMEKGFHEAFEKISKLQNSESPTT